MKDFILLPFRLILSLFAVIAAPFAVIPATAGIQAIIKSLNNIGVMFLSSLQLEHGLI